MVAPEWPPMTGMVYFGASPGDPIAAATNVEARTMSRWDTPKSLQSEDSQEGLTFSGQRRRPFSTLRRTRVQSS